MADTNLDGSPSQTSTVSITSSPAASDEPPLSIPSVVNARLMDSYNYLHQPKENTKFQVLISLGFINEGNIYKDSIIVPSIPNELTQLNLCLLSELMQKEPVQDNHSNEHLSLESSLFRSLYLPIADPNRVEMHGLFDLQPNQHFMFCINKRTYVLHNLSRQRIMQGFRISYVKNDYCPISVAAICQNPNQLYLLGDSIYPPHGIDAKLLDNVFKLLFDGRPHREHDHILILPFQQNIDSEQAEKGFYGTELTLGDNSEILSIFTHCGLVISLCSVLYDELISGDNDLEVEPLDHALHHAFQPLGKKLEILGEGTAQMKTQSIVAASAPVLGDNPSQETLDRYHEVNFRPVFFRGSVARPIETPDQPTEYAAPTNLLPYPVQIETEVVLQVEQEESVQHDNDPMDVDFDLLAGGIGSLNQDESVPPLDTVENQLIEQQAIENNFLQNGSSRKVAYVEPSFHMYLEQIRVHLA